MRRISGILLGTILVFVYSLNISAQKNIITGKVYNSNGEPVSNVKVYKPSDESNQFVTDKEGKYTITAEQDSILVFRYRDDITKSVPIKGNDTLDVVLRTKGRLIDAGYQNIDAEEYVGATKKIKTEDALSNFYGDISTKLQGRVSGMNMTKIGGAPGARKDMHIRGISSINSGAQPLIVIDGVPVDNKGMSGGGFSMAALSEFNPSDIESIQVLKDAAATGMYGARGGNGVISIQTEDPEFRQKEEYNFSYEQSVLYEPTNTHDLLNAEQFYDVAERAWDNSGYSGNPEIALDGYEGFNAYDTTTGNRANYHTNWMDHAINQGTYQRLNGSYTNSDKRTKYYISGLYRGESNYLFSGKFDKTGARIKLVHTPFDEMEFGMNLFGSYSKRDVNPQSWYTKLHTKSLPIYPLNSPERDAYWYTFDNEVNLMQLNKYSENRMDVFHTLNNAYISLTPLDNLTFKSKIAVDYQYNHLEEYRHPYVYPAGRPSQTNVNTTGNGIVVQHRYENTNWFNNNTITYQKTFSENHNIKALGGFSLQEFRNEKGITWLEGIGLTFDQTNGQTNKKEKVAAMLDNVRYSSIYGRANYDYKQKYLAQVSLRADGSSKYGKDSRWGYFPSIGLGWIASQESFLEDVSFINYAKLRGSYGISGNSNIGNYSHYSLGNIGYYEPLGDYNTGKIHYGSYGIANIVMQGFTPLTFGNSKLQWEDITKINIGIDLSMLDKRIKTSINYYYNYSNSLIAWEPLSVNAGAENDYYLSNSAGMQNMGIELDIQTINYDASDKGGLKWTTSFTLTTVANEVTALPDDIASIDGDYTKAVEGEPIGTYFLKDYEALEQEAENNNPDYSNVERELLSGKTPFPNIYGGLYNQLEYKQFKLGFLLNYQQGNYKLDLGEQSLDVINEGSTGTTDLTDKEDIKWDSELTRQPSDKYLYDASYMRLQEVSLVYTLPQTLTNPVGLNQSEIFVKAYNLITLTGYEGLDPETMNSNYRTNDVLNHGNVNFAMPQTRTITLGAKINFN